MEPSENTKALTKESSTDELVEQIIATSSGKKRTSEAPLRSVFTAVVDEKKVVIDLKTLELIITNELHINLKYVDETLLKVLPYMLVSYIKSWPGWTKVGDYLDGTLTLDEWFGKFHQYAIFKLKQLIQKGYNKVLEELDNESSGNKTDNLTSSMCQTETNIDSNGKDFAPFSLNVEGPPKILNTIIFSAEKDDLHLKMHPFKPWTTDFNLPHLINWPFLEVDFSCQFFSLKRKIVPNYLRYLATTDDTNHFRKPDFIDDVKVEPKERDTLTVPFMKKYFESYLEFMKIQKYNSTRIGEAAVILTEFYRDILEIGKVTDGKINNFTSISFNIGRCRYVRNKKQATNNNNQIQQSRQSDGPMIGLCELITPKCVIQAREIFIGDLQKIFEETSNIPVSSFLARHARLVQNMNGVLLNESLGITYCCLYCKKQYEGSFAMKAILKHFQEDHRLEHEIKCNSCKKQYNVGDLSKTRWFHRCSKNPELNDPCLESLTLS